MASKQMEILLNEIASHPFIFDFNRDGWGLWLLEITANAIMEYMDAELDPDGTRWDELSEGYALWKSEHYPGKIMAELDMIMKTMEQLIGAYSIQGQEMHQLFGTDEVAQQHSVWFQEGSVGEAEEGTVGESNDGKQPPRPFYALNPKAITDLDAECDQHFVDKLP